MSRATDAPRRRTPSDLWVLVLAGGDGRRLQDLTRAITGTPIPKQYCRIVGNRSLLETTLARVAPLAAPERTAVVVTRHHLALARPQLRGVPRANVLVQPYNRDTGPGLIFALLTLAPRSPDATLAVFPSDHFVGDEPLFLSYVAAARRGVRRSPRKLVLLGMVPDRAEPGYGYIEPGSRFATGGREPAFHVARFHEKPAPAVAAALLARGALWNSFVLVGRLARLLDLLREVRPDDVARVAEAMSDTRGTAERYATLPPWSFCAGFLTRIARHLVVVPCAGVEWSDWGTAEAIARTLARRRQTPAWAAAGSGAAA